MIDYYYREEKDYLSVIKECFITDPDLLVKWHIEAPATLDKCVKRTYNDLQKASNFKFFTMYCSTEDSDEVVGFFGIEKSEMGIFMTSFFIKPKYRNTTTMDFFWNIVIPETGENFFTAIYAMNVRAKKFLEKNGFELIQITDVKEKSEALLYKNN